MKTHFQLLQRWLMIWILFILFKKSSIFVLISLDSETPWGILALGRHGCFSYSVGSSVLVKFGDSLLPLINGWWSLGLLLMGCQWVLRHRWLYRLLLPLLGFLPFAVPAGWGFQQGSLCGIRRHFPVSHSCFALFFISFYSCLGIKHLVCLANILD